MENVKIWRKKNFVTQGQNIGNHGYQKQYKNTHYRPYLQNYLTGCHKNCHRCGKCQVMAKKKFVTQGQKIGNHGYQKPYKNKHYRPYI